MREGSRLGPILGGRVSVQCSPRIMECQSPCPLQIPTLVQDYERGEREKGGGGREGGGGGERERESVCVCVSIVTYPSPSSLGLAYPH